MIITTFRKPKSYKYKHFNFSEIFSPRTKNAALKSKIAFVQQTRPCKIYGNIKKQKTFLTNKNNSAERLRNINPHKQK